MAATPSESDCANSNSNNNNRVAPSSSSIPPLRRHIVNTYRRRRFMKQAPPIPQFTSHNTSSDALNEVNNLLLNNSMNVVMEDNLKARQENGGSVGECIKAAFQYHGEQSCVDKEFTSTANCPSEAFVPSTSSKKIDGIVPGQSDGLLTNDSRSRTELCQRTFSDIMESGEFASLCKLLSDNFQGIKVDRLFDCSFIDRRLTEGVYEVMPVLFPSDIDQFWKRLERVGAEMILLSRSMSNRSKARCIQSGVLSEDTPVYKKQQGLEFPNLSTQRLDSHDNANQQDALADVRKKSDGKEFLMCKLCKEMYHFPCIEPALKEISSRNGYCGKCIVKETGLPHDNCVVCRKLQPPRVVTNEDCEKLEVTNAEISSDHEESSNSDVDEHICKVCSTEIGNSERYQICGHEFCQGRFYHERCLTIQQLKSHASCWYCPSCLCRVCFINKDDDKIVLCDGCDHGYHIHCLNPPLSSIPRGRWFCAACKAGMTEIARVRKTYMSGFTVRRKGNEACKESDEQSKKKQNTTDRDLSNKEDGMDILSTAANTQNKDE